MDTFQKTNIEMTHQEWVKIEYNKQDIFINPYISISNKTELLRNYIDNYFKDSDITSSYIESEYGLILQIVDLCTNINISDGNGQIIIQIDNLIGSGLWDKIRNSIINYESLRNDLSIIIEKIEEKIALQKSLGENFDKITNRIFMFLDKLMELDLSEKGISELLIKLKEETDNYNEKFGNTTKKSVKRIKKDLIQ